MKPPRGIKQQKRYETTKQTSNAENDGRIICLVQTGRKVRIPDQSLYPPSFQIPNVYKYSMLFMLGNWTKAEDSIIVARQVSDVLSGRSLLSHYLQLMSFHSIILVFNIKKAEWGTVKVLPLTLCILFKSLSIIFLLTRQ